MKLTVCGVDAALKNMGLVRGVLDMDTNEFKVSELKLIVTEKQANKVVRQSSDDLRRAKELYTEFQEFTKDANIVFAEIPSGGQSARAVYGFGIAVGIIASCHVPVIQVQPAEAKLAAVGTRTASKEEMIEWAVQKFPEANWIRARNKKDGSITSANEHLADACAIVMAGVKTDQFRQLRSLSAIAA
jgi:Holliday junction resolvasome RuvABC endonuclease subunit